MQSAAPARVPTARLGRGAMFAFGAAVATSLNVAGCAESQERNVDAAAGDQDAAVDGGGIAPAYGAPEIDAAVEVDAGAPVPLYGGAPTVDAGRDASGGHDAGRDAGGGAAPAYGAPPES